MPTHINPLARIVFQMFKLSKGVKGVVCCSKRIYWVLDQPICDIFQYVRFFKKHLSSSSQFLG